ncbi:MAG: hypothetical protein ABW151_06715 [Pseudorhodoplanes sp.]
MRKTIAVLATAFILATAASSAYARPVADSADSVPTFEIRAQNSGSQGGSYNYKNSRDALDTCRYC